MFKNKIKNFTAISMIAISLGVSSASAADGKVASDGANESKKSLGEKRGKSPYRMVDLGSGALSESKISEQSEKITFSMEWLNSLSLEEKKSIDFSQVDFSEFIDSHIKIPNLMGGNVPPSRKMSSGYGEVSSNNTIDRMSGATRLATASDFNRILGEAQVDATMSGIRRYELTKRLQNKAKPEGEGELLKYLRALAHDLSQHSINYSQMKPKSNNIELETEKSNV